MIDTELMIIIAITAVVDTGIAHYILMPKLLTLFGL